MTLNPLLNAGISASFNSRAGLKDNVVRLEITNWANIMKELNKYDKTIVRELKSEFKRIAKGPQDAVKKAIPGRSKPPLSQMRQVHFGRLAWGTTYGGGGARPKPAKSVLVQVPTKKKNYRKLNEYPIVRLQIGSPATVLADMAGSRGGIKGRKGLTPEYDYMYTINGQKVPGKRKHRVVPGAFMKSLAKAGKGLQRPYSSRMVWPAVDKAMPKAVREMDSVITEVNRRVSARLARNV